MVFPKVCPKINLIMKVKSFKIHPVFIAVLFIGFSAVTSIYVGILIEKLQVVLYQRLFSTSLYQGGYGYFAVSVLLLFWVLGLYHILKKKAVLLFLFPLFVLFLLGFFQRIVLYRDTLILASPFIQKKISLGDIEKLTIKYVETRTNERISQCLDFFYLTTRNEGEIALENWAYPAEKLFKDIQSLRKVSVTCEIHFWECDYRKYPLHSNLSSNQLCEEVIDFTNGDD